MYLFLNFSEVESGLIAFFPIVILCWTDSVFPFALVDIF